MANKRYDPDDKANQYPKMLYKGVEYRTVGDDKEEADARKAGFIQDAPSGRIEPTSPKAGPGAAKASAPDGGMEKIAKAIQELTLKIDGVEAGVRETLQNFDERLAAMEAAATEPADGKPAPKGK